MLATVTCSSITKTIDVTCTRRHSFCEDKSHVNLVWNYQLCAKLGIMNRLRCLVLVSIVTTQSYPKNSKEALVNCSPVLEAANKN